MTMPKKTTLKISVLAGLLAGGMAAAPVQALEIKGNIGVTSDYIFRGTSQNAGNSSISGGIDADLGDGLYLGTWVADATYGEASYELDIYAGYSGEVGIVSYDIGYFAGLYPDAPKTQKPDFTEAYLTLGVGAVSLSHYYLLNASGKEAGDDSYTTLGFETALADGWGLALSYGVASITGDEDDNVDMSLTLSKGDFSLAFINTKDIVAPEEEDTSYDDDLRVVVSWGKSF